MKTIVLDDDPTGTQSATGAAVLLVSDADALTELLSTRDSVYVQTNSRALPEAEAVALATSIRADGEAVAERLGEPVRFVLRGDSTLRGHVFAETEVFLGGDAIMLFVPAFPEGGRTTRDGVHYVRIDGVDIPAHESEYADDPVFPFASGVLAEYVREKSAREPIVVSQSVVNDGGLAAVLRDAPRGSVVLPDAASAADIRLIAAAVDDVTADGVRVVVRSASPLAAELAGVASAGLMERPLVATPGKVLLVCGSHTFGATAQLERVMAYFGAPAVLDTDAAMYDTESAATAVIDAARVQLSERGLAIVTSERVRSSTHNTLAHGERVMAALTTAVAALLPDVDVIVSKGGITSAEVASTGIGARSAVVRGQVSPGVSVWQMSDRSGREILYVVVPGNVGGADTLVDVLDALGVSASPESQGVTR